MGAAFIGVIGEVAQAMGGRRELGQCQQQAKQQRTTGSRACAQETKWSRGRHRRIGAQVMNADNRRRAVVLLAGNAGCQPFMRLHDARRTAGLRGRNPAARLRRALAPQSVRYD